MEMEENSSKGGETVTLNIGGKRFETFKSTLLQVENTYFHAMLANGKWNPRSDGIHALIQSILILWLL
jgi:hypothetical protein